MCASGGTLGIVRLGRRLDLTVSVFFV